MCGIVGLFLKDHSLQNQLGQLLSQMLITMSDRGPDSAGVAIYGEPANTESKITIQSDKQNNDFETLESILREKLDERLDISFKDTHAVIRANNTKIKFILELIENYVPRARVMSVGSSIEIYKETGMPSSVIDRFSIHKMKGSHGIGHTRMATESEVTTLGAHPFSTAPDECLVHNGSLSNHNNLRRNLVRDGIKIETENDSEIAAAYLTNQMSDGAT